MRPDAIGRAAIRADALLVRISRTLHLIHRFTPENAVDERARMVKALSAGDEPTPRWTYAAREDLRGAREAIRRAVRALARDGLDALYRRRLHELRAQIELAESVGEKAAVLRASRRVFGSVDPATHSLALEWLRTPAPREPRELPPVAPRGAPSVATVLRAEMLEYGVLWPVRLEPRLAAAAAIAAGEVLLGGTRRYSRAEVQRLAAHEIGVHVVAHVNACDQPLGIFALGTAAATRDQEGLALWAEVARGAFTPHRRRMLAARTIAVASLEAGATFADAARRLVEEFGLSEEDAVIACERAFRGGGLTKDAVYLAGFVRIGQALATDALDLEAMSIGRVGLADAALVRALLDRNVLVAPRRTSRELGRLVTHPRRSRFELATQRTLNG